MASIFDKERLSASQLRTVADRRFDDADYLRKSRSNARANGVLYLGGFVIECLLKARLAEEYPTIATTRDPSRLSRTDRRTWELIYRSHELDRMLEHLPGIEIRMQAAHRRGGAEALASLKKICGEWTIFARYSTRAETMQEASRFLNEIRELRPWLKQ